MDYWGGGGQVHICVQSVQQTWGVWGHVPQEILIFDLTQFHGIWDCFHTHIIFTIYWVIKAFIKA